MENFELKLQKAESEASQEETKETVLFCRPDELAGKLQNLTAQSSLEDSFKDICDDPDLLAHVSYWEKWLTRDQASMLERVRLDHRVEVRKKELPLGLEERFDEKDLDLIFSNVSAIQLTVGCSIGCPHCGFDAIKGVKEEIPYEQLKNMFERYGKQLHKGAPFLYWASDPSDYRSKDKDGNQKSYQDVHRLAVNESRYEPGITTQNHEAAWLDELRKMKRNQDPAIESSFRVSTHGLSDDDVSKIVEKEEEGKLHVVGNKDASGKRKKFLGMGITQKKLENIDPDTPKSGIACKDGILITPRGLYGFVVVPISQEFPQGQIIMPLHEISDLPIEKGNDMREVLTRSVVATKDSHQGNGVDEEYRYQKFDKSEVQRQAVVYTDKARYMASFDGMSGIITDSVCLIDNPDAYLKDNMKRLESSAKTYDGTGSLFEEVTTLVLSLMQKVIDDEPSFEHKINSISRTNRIARSLFSAKAENSIEEIEESIRKINDHVMSVEAFGRAFERMGEGSYNEQAVSEFKENIKLVSEILSKSEN